MANKANVANAEGATPDVQRTLVDARPPTLPRPRMTLAQRAKIFVPFDPLKGYQDALREKEREAEEAHIERASLEESC